MARRILVVDDEKLVVEGLEISLAQDGYETDRAYDGKEALEKLSGDSFDFVLLDIMMPEMDGLTVLRRIRESSGVPVMMLSARSEDTDKIAGLEAGADDYVTKPFNTLEVKARIKAILRRVSLSSGDAFPDHVVENGDLKMDIDNRRLFIRGKEIGLTSREFDMLELFLTHPGKVYGRENLLSLIWGDKYPGDVRTVDVHVRRLREKIEDDPSKPAYVLTKWGVGYYYGDKRR